jgi:uncharacterized protein YndB with AHSA1/START domain
MTRFRNEVMIARPADDVFRFVSDFENMSKWNYFVVGVHKIGSGPIGVGTVFRQARKTDTQEYQITEFEPDRRVAVETLPPAAGLVMRFTFESIAGGTRLTDAWELRGGLLAVLGSLAAGRAKAAVAENLAKLKELLEHGEVRLQDGRFETICYTRAVTNPRRRESCSRRQP